MKPLDPLSDAELERLTRDAVALPDAPPGLINRAIGLWPEKAAPPTESAVAAMRRLVAAVLSFDSWAAPLPAGVRAVPSDVRHLLFSASGRDVDLRIAPAADRFTLSGQILGPDESGSVELLEQTASNDSFPLSRTAALDELGTFRLDGVPSGTYLVTLRVGTDDVVLPPIDVGEQRG